MQTICKNEDERSSSRGTNTIGSLICTREIGRCVEGEYIIRLGREFVKI